MQFRPEWHVLQYTLNNWHQGVPNTMTPESRLQWIMKNTSRQLSEHFSHTWKHTTRRAKLLHPHTVHIQSAAARPAFAIAPRLDPPGKDPGPPVGLLLFDNPVPKTEVNMSKCFNQLLQHYTVWRASLLHQQSILLPPYVYSVWNSCSIYTTPVFWHEPM